MATEEHRNHTDQSENLTLQLLNVTSEVASYTSTRPFDITFADFQCLRNCQHKIKENVFYNMAFETLGVRLASDNLSNLSGPG